jgi:hypothetical protein
MSHRCKQSGWIHGHVREVPGKDRPWRIDLYGPGGEHLIRGWQDSEEQALTAIEHAVSGIRQVIADAGVPSEEKPLPTGGA